MAKLVDEYYVCKKCGSNEFNRMMTYNIRIIKGKPALDLPEATGVETRCCNCGSKVQDN